MTDITARTWERPCTCDTYGSRNGYCTWALCRCWHHDEPTPDLSYSDREDARYMQGDFTETERQLTEVYHARRAWLANQADEAWLAEHDQTAEPTEAQP